MKSTYDLLIEKSKEAFVLAIEIYNKPSIKYRLEGFSFLLCNAWELMLKAHLIKRDGEDSIYYPDKPSRTISLERCIRLIFTNEKAPIRLNLEKVMELRNTSTHFITEEYEMLYIPILQACVFNFTDKMKEFHDIDMSDIIPDNFITLSVSIKALDETEIRGKYTEQIAEKIINTRTTLSEMIEDNNSNFAVRIEHLYYLTKNRNEATELYHIASDAEEGVRTIKQIQNPNATHKYNASSVIEILNKRIKKNGIHLLYKGEPSALNQYLFKLFIDYFDMKNNTRFCYPYTIPKQPQYSYSMAAIDFIYGEIIKQPETILDDLKEKLARKKLTPGAKDSK